ncbi:hypothetical protein OG896_24445 [Streptomyces sp. NBC_00669]|uniref:hypothetical protein n=1 Tax=Streptomyces sp. NBC_00669 TaxID=2976011 RepID=UPI002E35E720|nr:hypothetical protein [Streptomyces sp. NBC_00669]
MAVGCATHSALIIDRGGAVITQADVLTKVEWNRTLDDISTATITVTPEGDCCQALARVRSWRHTLAIYRDNQPCWEGPIVTPQWTADGVTITAVDVVGWLARRVPHRSIAFKARDLAEIADWLITDGFAPDDPGHEVQIVAPTRIRGDRAYTQDVGLVSDHLADLADTGVDYTAVGSRILLLPEDFTGRVGSLTDADFPNGLTVTEDGSSLATRVVVAGQQGQQGQPDIMGTAGGVDDYYGLLETYVDEPSVLDDASAAAAALSHLRASNPAPVFITSQEATLAPDAAVDVPSLVPGWCVDVSTTRTCRTIAQSMKIRSVKVTEDSTGEAVAVTLAPAGA